MRGHVEYDIFQFPFGGHFGPRFGGMGGPFGCDDFPGHHGRRPGFGPYSERHGHHHHGPEHRRCGPPEDGHRRPRCGCRSSPESDSDGPSDRHYHGRGQRHGPSCQGSGPHGPRPWLRHSPERHCFRRRGVPEFPERSWGGPFGIFDHHRPGYGRHGPCRPWFGHRRPCPYDCSGERPARNANCERYRENEPCCSKNKENRGCDTGRRQNGHCSGKDKDQNPTGDTVFVQRIVLEKATRPQSV